MSAYRLDNLSQQDTEAALVEPAYAHDVAFEEDAIAAAPAGRHRHQTSWSSNSGVSLAGMLRAASYVVVFVGELELHRQGSSRTGSVLCWLANADSTCVHSPAIWISG